MIGIAGACMLLWPAFYNGYPTIFSDTGGYLITGKFFVALPPFRAPGYSLFMRLTSLGFTGWLTVICQAILVIYVLHETCDFLIEGDGAFADICLLAATSGLAALTSLPWVASLLMPDVFAGVLFLSAFLLAFADDFGWMRRLLLAGILAISVAAHSSLLPIAVLLAIALMCLKYVLVASTIDGPALRLSTSRTLLWLVLPIFVASLATATLNRATGLGFRLSPAKNSFLLARLFGDGLAADFLRANCATHRFISCQYLSELPRTQEEFLFQHPLYGDLKEGHQDEMEQIVQGTIRAYPFQFAASSVRESLLQLASLRTGDEIRSFGAREWNSEVLPQIYPADAHAFENSKQLRDRLTPLADSAAAIDTPVFWFSIGMCLLAAWSGRFSRMNVFFRSLLLFLGINAAVCASFAGVYDRYQGRVAWLAPFCLAAFLCCFAKEWKGWRAVQEMGEMEELELPSE